MLELLNKFKLIRKDSERYKTFRMGGVRLLANKMSSSQKIEQAPLPNQAVIVLSQGTGAPAQAIVTKGDVVKVGTLIAKASGLVSSNIHASVSGKVARLDEVIDMTGTKHQAILIDVDGDEWETSIDTTDDLIKDISFTQEEILHKIFQAGVVGLGGAAFPTHLKLSSLPGKKANVLIINAVECEPYLSADHQLMLEKGEECLVGVQLLMRALDVNSAIIGIEENKADAIALLSSLVYNYPGIEICPLQEKYPQGGEKQLIDAILKQRVLRSTLPIDIGVVVQNIATAYAVYEAVQKNKPLVERIVSVCGEELERSANLRVRIGTPVSRLIDVCGGLPANTGKIIAGGPMMGKALVSADVPLTKACAGVLVMPNQDSRRASSRVCIRCAKCVHVCPMGLQPFLLMNTAEHQFFAETESLHVLDCIECGACSYACPSSRPLLDYIRLGKAKVNENIRKRK